MDCFSEFHHLCGQAQLELAIKLNGRGSYWKIICFEGNCNARHVEQKENLTKALKPIAVFPHPKRLSLSSS